MGSVNVFTDNFNRSNSSTLGANWSEALGNWSIASNRLQAPTSGTGPFECVTTTSAHAAKVHQTVQVTHVTGSAFDGGIIARFLNTSNFYSVYVSAGNIGVYKCVSGSFSQVGSNVAVTITANSVIKFQVGDGNSASAIKVWYNGTLTHTLSDSSITSAGQAGVFGYTTSQQFEDFAVDENLPTFTATHAKTVAGVTFTGSATFTPKFTGSAAKTIGPATFTGSATFTTPGGTYEGELATTVAGAQCTGNASFNNATGFTARNATTASGVISVGVSVNPTPGNTLLVFAIVQAADYVFGDTPEMAISNDNESDFTLLETSFGGPSVMAV